jgi:hypothetical protein
VRWQKTKGDDNKINIPMEAVFKLHLFVRLALWIMMPPGSFVDSSINLSDFSLQLQQSPKWTIF